jgi:hypothetical protein
VSYLELQDVGIAGIGCDLAGGILLGLGLVVGHAELARGAGSFYGSPGQAVAVAKSRVDALSGLAALGIGFLLQAVDYAASLVTPVAPRRGTAEVLAGVAVGFVALAATLLLGWLHRRLRLTPTLVEMSRYTPEGRLDHPQAGLLPSWLEALGHERRRGEDDLAFARRAAGVENLTGE